MFEPIAGDGNAQRFALTLCPDGVYRVDGGTIPISNHPAGGIDDGKPVIGVHSGNDVAVSLLGAMLGTHKEE